MKCQKCNKEFEENKLQESHDVPCYLFWGETRRINKQLADKFGRRYLCKKCHKNYEIWLRGKVISFADIKSREYFRDE